ncbi:hypothetical protein ASE14_14245 [Agromyces sp. Root81]|nr:DUF2809 domain-containing protein [Agromyces sp. Root81]KRC61935.1 hypothetical protein ASE14_14245 [Agromyces sp. Root81]
MSEQRPPATTDSRGIRARTAVAAVVCLAIGVCLQLLERTLIVDLLGSVLYVGLIAFLLRSAWPRLGGARSSALAFAVAATVELLQLTGLPHRAVEVFPPARLVLGGSFDPIDLVAYAVGAALAFIVQLALAGAGRGGRSRTPPASGAGTPLRRSDDSEASDPSR